MKPRPGECFYDLGSGTGKAVLTAAALYPLGAAKGIEIQPSLHDAALRTKAKLESCATQARIALRTPMAAVQFECGDALEGSWVEDADLVFCTTTCLSSSQVVHKRR